jgi:hypothetical protein
VTVFYVYTAVQAGQPVQQPVAHMTEISPLSP